MDCTVVGPSPILVRLMLSRSSALRTSTGLPLSMTRPTIVPSMECSEGGYVLSPSIMYSNVIELSPAVKATKNKGASMTRFTWS